MRAEEELDEIAQKEVLEMKIQGYTYRQICDFLKDRYQVNLSESDLKNFVNQREQNALKVLKGSEERQGELAEQYFDTIQQVKKLNLEMWKVFMDVKNSPEYKQSDVACPHCGGKVKVRFKSANELTKIADHLLKQIEHVDKVLKKLQSGSQLNVTYNITDITQKIAQIIPQFDEMRERQGEIKIIKKKKKNVEVTQN